MPRVCLTLLRAGVLRERSAPHHHGPNDMRILFVRFVKNKSLPH